MIAITFVALVATQLPTPQAAAPPAAPAAPQTLVLLQYAQPPAPTAPSVLVANPPLWDRLMERTGHWLLDRAAKHQHPKPLRLVGVQPAPVGYQLVPLQPINPPAASAQSEAAPPAPPISDASILVPVPGRADAIDRLFGARRWR